MRRTLAVDLEAQTVTLPDGQSIAFDMDPYQRRSLLLGLDEIGSILADDAADIADLSGGNVALYPWLELEDGRLDRLFAGKKERDDGHRTGRQLQGRVRQAHRLRQDGRPC